MENELVSDSIQSLRGRRGYEEKKVANLGFASLYDYFEDKIAKETKAVREKKEGSLQSKPLRSSKIKKTNKL